MKRLRLLLLLPAILTVASCADSLENIVQAHQQARIEAANAHRPIARGYADGMGELIAESEPQHANADGGR